MNNPDGIGDKYQRLFKAQQILLLSKHIMLLDMVEPIKDLNFATDYLKKFTLEK
jgi:hypothetical protein